MKFPYSGLVFSISFFIYQFGHAAYQLPQADEKGEFRDSHAVTEKWFADPGTRFPTPGSPEGRWSTVDEAHHFILTLAGESERLSLHQVGESLLGIPIWALIHEPEDPNAMTVHIQARVHGNEPASTEGALALAWDLAKGDLRDVPVRVVLIPVLNPEGARRGERRTQTDIDPNRDYVHQNSGSVRAVFRLVDKYDPVVVVDMHEHRAWAWPTDMMAIGPNQPNLPAFFNEFVHENYIEHLKVQFEEKDLRFAPYRLIQLESEELRIRESATTFVSEKNAVALGGRVSILTEGRGIGLGDQHFHRRTWAQYLVARTILLRTLEIADELKTVVRATRESIRAAEDPWILRSEPKEIPHRVELFDLRTDSLADLDATFVDRTNGTPTATADRPRAYMVHASQQSLLDRLRRIGLEMERLEESTTQPVEVTRITSFEAGKATLYGGVLTRGDGAWIRPPLARNHDIQIERFIEERSFPPGSVRIPVNQSLGLYLLKLEPEAFSSYAALGFWGDSLEPGFEFPVFRLKN